MSDVDCSRCGRKHRRGKCPAFNAVCYCCHKRGHFQSCCKSRNVPTTPVGDQEDNSIDTAFLNTVGEEDSRSWFVNLTLGNREVSFKIDTGAEVTAVSEKVWKQSKRPRLQSPCKTLYGPAHEPLPVVGQFFGVLAYKGTSVKQTIYVIKDLKNCLLWLPTIKALNLLTKAVDAVIEDRGSEIVKKFPALFKGLGNLKDPYEIKLCPDAKPFALCVPRRVPISLREQVRKELEQMESGGIISKMDEPTAWCSGIVVIPKANGKIRICVDLTHLNKSVQRDISSS